MTDNSGSGLKQVELWRKDESSDWQEIKPPNMLAGETGPISGSFTDMPPAPGKYWYGVHVVDNAGNWNDEQNADTANQPGDWGPAEVEIVDGNTAVGRTTAIRLFSNVPKTDSSISRPNVYSEVSIDTTRYDRTPYHMTDSYYGTVTIQPGQRCFLAGDAEGTAGWKIDNSLLFEIQTNTETRCLVCGVDPVYYNGERAVQIGENKFNFGPREIDLTEYFPEGETVELKVSALDYGDFGYLSDIYLIMQSDTKV